MPSVTPFGREIALLPAIAHEIAALSSPKFRTISLSKRH